MGFAAVSDGDGDDVVHSQRVFGAGAILCVYIHRADEWIGHCVRISGYHVVVLRGVVDVPGVGHL